MTSRDDRPELFRPARPMLQEVEAEPPTLDALLRGYAELDALITRALDQKDAAEAVRLAAGVTAKEYALDRRIMAFDRAVGREDL